MTTSAKKTADGRVNVFVNDAEIAAACKDLLKVRRVPSRAFSLSTKSDWNHLRDAVLQTEKGRILIACTASKIPSTGSRITFKASSAEFLLLTEGAPVQSLSEKIRLLGARGTSHVHLTDGSVAQAAEILMRKISSLVSPAHRRIIDAWIEADQLCVLGSTDTLHIPLSLLTDLIGSESIRDFEIDVDGSFLYWALQDVHLGWDQLDQLIHPHSKIAAEQRSREFNEKYGRAIRAFRQACGLKQTDIPGFDPRHVRRIEQGRNRATPHAIACFAQAHGLGVSKYMMEVANRLT
jgi:hypothetical protein